MNWLVNEDDVGAAIPAPFSGNSPESSTGDLDNLAGTDLLKQADHATRARSAIDEDRQWSCFRHLPCFDEPEERIDTIIDLTRAEDVWWEGDITCELSLGGEYCGTGSDIR